MCVGGRGRRRIISTNIQEGIFPLPISVAVTFLENEQK